MVTAGLAEIERCCKIKDDLVILSGKNWKEVLTGDESRT